ncbi:hypothetical protein F4009_24340 [Candidatus Poribacteria bacterium]|nr:hypothetical protein [Candidatus Poribacteria bacterium]
MNDTDFSANFAFNTMKIVSQQLALVAEQAICEIELLQNQEHFDLKVLSDLFQTVETAHQILHHISCLDDPVARIEDLLIRLGQIDKDN